MNKSKWLGGLKNGTGSDAPTWRGDRLPKSMGDSWTKAILIAHLRKLGLIK